MNQGPFKDPLCYLCLLCTVLGSLSQTQEVTGSNNNFHKNVVSEFKKFSDLGENLSGKSPLFQCIVILKYESAYSPFHRREGIQTDSES